MHIPSKDAGAASGLVNVTQQLGGTLGLAILVTIFGSASKHAGHLLDATPLAQAHHVFTVSASHAFVGAALFLLAAFVLVTAAVKPSGSGGAPAGASAPR